MTRKRITLNAIEKIEQALDISCEAVESAVFGICDLNRNVVKCLRMTADGVSETDGEPTILIPQKLEKLLYPKRIKVIHGGRGSGKTRTVTSILTERARFKRERVACFREIQASIKESSYQEIADEIERKNEGDEFRQVDGEITHKLTRSKFSFKGLYRNLTTVKGFAGATIAWVEEAENISQTSIDILEPTIRAPGSEIWLTFNPNKPTDAIWTNFVEPYLDRMVDGVYEDDETLIIEVNYVDNPWFTEELEMTRQKAMRTDLDRYNWIWLGRFNKRSDELVLGGKYVVQDFTPTDEWDGPYLGADFGFAQDPSTLVVCWVYDGILYVEHEGYGSGVEIDQLGEMYERAYPRAKEYVIRADCSRPETISYVARQGFKIEGCEKWSGSVEDGVTHLRSYERIVIHSRCKHTTDEAARYSYKVDKNTGDVLPDIVDKHNHCIAEGELISTGRGFIPVENVVIGDTVDTRVGKRVVTNHWVSGVNMPTMRISTESGSVRCTHNHEVFVHGKGFIRADMIRYGDWLVINNGGDEWSRHLNTVGSYLGGTRTHPEGVTLSISSEQ